MAQNIVKQIKSTKQQQHVTKHTKSKVFWDETSVQSDVTEKELYEPTAATVTKNRELENPQEAFKLGSDASSCDLQASFMPGPSNLIKIEQKPALIASRARYLRSNSETPNKQ